MPTFEFIAKVGGYICAKSDNNPDFDLLLGLEDMYTGIGASATALNMCQ